MDQKTWHELVTKDVIPSATPWVLAVDYVPAATILKFECKDPNKQSWTCAESRSLVCGPDGRAANAAPDLLPVSTAPFGSLVAKLGGSTAANDGAPFAVGSFCIHKVGDTEAGPLFLGANIAASSIPTGANTAIAVTVWEAKP